MPKPSLKSKSARQKSASRSTLEPLSGSVLAATPSLIDLVNQAALSPEVDTGESRRWWLIWRRDHDTTAASSASSLSASVAAVEAPVATARFRFSMGGYTVNRREEVAVGNAGYDTAEVTELLESRAQEDALVAYALASQANVREALHRLQRTAS